MESETRVTKVKYDGQKVRVEYQRTKEGHEPDEFTFYSTDKPVPEFEQALQALTADVVTVCELAAGDGEKLTVRGVTLTWTNDIMGGCVTALKTLKTADSPLVLNTPHLPSEPYGEGNDMAPTLPAGMAERLMTVADHAMEYVNGKRAQGELFDKPAAA